MGISTKISWTDSTFNMWIGCTKVSEGCKFCYAETQNKLYKWSQGWGVGVPRKLTSEKNQAKPMTWAKKIAGDSSVKKWRIFCSSLSDIFDDDVPQAWRNHLWDIIEKSTTLSNNKFEWLLLTKRIENAKYMLPKDWLRDPMGTPNIRLGITAENDLRFQERLPILFDTWGAGKNFISVEPMLGPVYIDEVNSIYVDWVICGGESGPNCRPMDLQWAVDLKNACCSMGIPFFMKQFGGYPDRRDEPNDWPDEFNIREFPE
jgi:protein gp37